MTVWTYSVKVTKRWGDNRPIWIFTTDAGLSIVNYMAFAPVAGDSIVFNLDTSGFYVFDSNFPPTMFNNYPSITGQAVGPTSLITFSSVTSPPASPATAYPSQGFTLTLSVVGTIPTGASPISMILFAVDSLGAGRICDSPDPTADPQPGHTGGGGP